MAPNVTFEPATLAHAEALAPLMRAADVAEVLALGYDGALDALTKALEPSEVASAMLFDGEVAMLFGVVPQGPRSALCPGGGCIWVLTGRAVAKHPKAFLRATPHLLAAMLRRYDYLGNWVDARYLGALRWARWLGFEVGAARPFGPSGLPFCPVAIRRHSWEH